MLEVLYQIFLMPIEQGVSLVFDYLTIHIHSYGLSVIFLSLIINTLLIPIFKTTDKLSYFVKQKRVRIEPKIEEINSCFSGQERFMMLQTLYRQNDYHPMMAFKASLGLLIQIPFFIVAYHFLSTNQDLINTTFLLIKDLSKPDELIKLGSMQINFLPVLMSVVSLLSAYIYARMHGKDTLKQNYFLTLLFLVLLYNVASALVLYWTVNNIFSLVKNIYALQVRTGIIRQDYSETEIQQSNTSDKSLVYRLFMLSYFILISLIFVYFPITVYSSDPSAFTHKVSGIFVLLGQYFIWLYIIGCILFYFLPDRIKTVLSFSTVFALILFILYSFVFIGDFGNLDHFMLNSRDIFEKDVEIVYDMLVPVLSIAVLMFILKFRYVKYLYTMLIIISLSTAILSIYKFYSVYGMGKELDQYSSKLPADNDRLLSYSSDGQNIVILMMDAFTGGFMEPMLKEYPELMTQLDGFTWYPNALSAANKTVGGAPGIRGGHKFRPDMFNKKGLGSADSVRMSMLDSFNVMNEHFTKAGYEFSIFNPYIINCNDIENYLNQPANCTATLAKYRNFWLENTNIDYIYPSITSRDYANVLVSISLFKSAPFLLKEKIYNSGYWRVFPEERKYNRYYQFAINEYSFLDSMRMASNVQSEKNTIKYIRTLFTHYPWMANEKCQLSLNPGGHYNSIYCGLKSVIKWLDWLKSMNIYDNTKIIIVSDHGEQDSPMLPPEFEEDVADSINNVERSRPHMVMMVKDFSSRGSLKTSDIFISNADTLSIACSAIGGCENVIDDPTQKPITNRELVYSVISGFGRDKYDVLSQFRVKNNIFKPENWTKIK